MSPVTHHHYHHHHQNTLCSSTQTTIDSPPLNHNYGRSTVFFLTLSSTFSKKKNVCKVIHVRINILTVLGFLILFSTSCEMLFINIQICKLTRVILWTFCDEFFYKKSWDCVIFDGGGCDSCWFQRLQQQPLFSLPTINTETTRTTAFFQWRVPIFSDLEFFTRTRRVGVDDDEGSRRRGRGRRCWFDEVVVGLLVSQD
jgi:hypothetical protein